MYGITFSQLPAAGVALLQGCDKVDSLLIALSGSVLGQASKSPLSLTVYPLGQL